MRDRSRRRRAFGTLAATAGIALLVGAPAALAQTDRTTPPTTTPPDESWAGSTLDDPLAAGSATFAVTDGPGERRVRQGSRRACGRPERQAPQREREVLPPRRGTGRCLLCPRRSRRHDHRDLTQPDQPPDPVQVLGRLRRVPVGVQRHLRGRRHRSRPAHLDRLASEDQRRSSPRPVTAVDATVSDEKRTVTVTWDEPADPEIGFLGYRIERAGPKDGDSFGAFAPIGDDADADTSSITDTLDEPGDYRYRVSTLRYARNAGGSKISLASLDKHRGRRHARREAVGTERTRPGSTTPEHPVARRLDRLAVQIAPTPGECQPARRTGHPVAVHPDHGRHGIRRRARLRRPSRSTSASPASSPARASPSSAPRARAPDSSLRWPVRWCWSAGPATSST